MGVVQDRPLKSFEAGARNWQRINALSGTSAEARNHASQLRYREARRGMDAAEVLFPFKIYQPSIELIDGVEFETFWRTFRVRAGMVMESNATGTDADVDATPNADPDALYYPVESTEILVPAATAKFWFWLEVGSAAGVTTAVVRYGPTPSAASYTPAGGDPTAAWTSTNVWSGAPVPDGQHIPVGWVDTQTYASTLQAVVRQLLRADVVQVGGGGDCPY